MDVKDFRRIVSCFSDTPANFAGADGEFVLQTLDETIVAKFIKEDGALYVIEDEVKSLAESWIIRRVSKIHVLVERLLASIPEPENFVEPDGDYLPDLESEVNQDGSVSESAQKLCLNHLGKQTPGTTQVIYLTSDAGEGKTTLISKLARVVAEKFKRKEVNWILLPIPLGGRAFLRFDEAVLAALMTRYRFQYWFFEGFVELVRMGIVIPAFDGFEEMIVENSSGEAVSALGGLIGQLGSEGKVLFAARKAFFEYQSFRTQARLFDAIGSEESAAFSRISLKRWSRRQFEDYAVRRGRKDGADIYDAVESRLGPEHPILTRAVLVRRLFDVASDISNANALVQKLGETPQAYFHAFVVAIVEREANEKWRDKANQSPLMTIEEHLKLLASVAREMWVSGSDTLRSDILDIVADMFAEEHAKGPNIARQIRERLSHHALLVKVGSGRPTFSFDHEDFRQFFLGMSLSYSLERKDVEQVRSLLRTALLPSVTLDESIHVCLKNHQSRESLISVCREVISSELPASFVPENAGNLVIRLLDQMDVQAKSNNISGFVFSSQALVGRSLQSVEFNNCYFGPTGLQGSQMRDVVFNKSVFERIEIDGQFNVSASFNECEIASLISRDGESAIYDPAGIQGELVACGFKFGEIEAEAPIHKKAEDKRLDLVAKILRAFMRATQHNEDTLRMRLGVDAGLFFDEVLPELLQVKVLVEIPYRGSGVQKRFRLSKPMSEIQSALASADGSFVNFCKKIR